MSHRETIERAIEAQQEIETRALVIDETHTALAARVTMKELRALLDQPGDVEGLARRLLKARWPYSQWDMVAQPARDESIAQARAAIDFLGVRVGESSLCPPHQKIAHHLADWPQNYGCPQCARNREERIKEILEELLECSATTAACAQCASRARESLDTEFAETGGQYVKTLMMEDVDRELDRIWDENGVFEGKQMSEDDWVELQTVLSHRRDLRRQAPPARPGLSDADWDVIEGLLELSIFSGTTTEEGKKVYRATASRVREVRGKNG